MQSDDCSDSVVDELYKLVPHFLCSPEASDDLHQVSMLVTDVKIDDDDKISSIVSKNHGRFNLVCEKRTRVCKCKSLQNALALANLDSLCHCAEPIDGSVVDFHDQHIENQNSKEFYVIKLYLTHPIKKN